MRVVFLGSGAIGIPSLKALAADGRHTVLAVFTQPDRPVGRNLELRPPPVKLTAGELDLRVYQPEKIRAPVALTELAALDPEIIVVAAYGQILPKAILSLPRFGCVNIHASLLPRHRGAAPIQAAILEGDLESGVTIMQMDEGLDTGDILRKVAVPISPHETAGSLHDRLAQLAPSALLECLDRLERGVATREKQDSTQATYAPKLRREDGAIDWNKSALQIERQIRAMTPWPGAYTWMPLRETPVVLKVHRAELTNTRSWAGGSEPGTVVAVGDDGIIVAAGEDGIVLQEIQIQGRKRLKVPDFLRGHPVPLGVRLEIRKKIFPFHDAEDKV
ncbi:MAG TPA: methionyl-tRNA formyltransferase [Terrimicrobiaceae bacterium]